jgi:hypothetical protein
VGKYMNGHAFISSMIEVNADVFPDVTRSSKCGTARVRRHDDVHEAESSQLTLDPSGRNKWGDLLQKIEYHRDTNLFGVGAPTLTTAGCTHGTLTSPR